jgi:hypothetical protein
MLDSLTNSARRLNTASGRPIFSFWGIATLVITAVVALLYWPALGGTAVWDDKGIISGQTIGGGGLLDSLRSTFNLAYYRPLTSLSYTLDLQLFGPDLFAFHATNIALHLCACFAVMWLAFTISNDRWIGLLAGLFFAVQPAQVGATAWIGGRTDTLACIFVMLFAGALVRYHRSNSLAWLLTSMGAFFLAAMAKEQTLALLLLVPISGALLRERGQLSSYKLTGCYLIVGLSFVALWLCNFPNPYAAEWVGPGELSRRFLLTLVHTAGQFVTPVPQNVQVLSLFPYQGPLWLVASFGLLLGCIVGLRALLKYDRQAAFLAMGALVAFLPVSNIVPVPSLLVGPYRMAVAGTFLAILFAWALRVWWARSPSLRAAGVANLALALATSMIIVPQWSSEAALFSSIHGYDPQSVNGASNYLATLQEQGRPADVKRVAEEALRTLLGPGWDGTPGDAVQLAHSPFTRLKLVQGNGTKAQPQKVVSTLLYHVASSHHQLQNERAALDALVAARTIDPQNAPVLTMLGDRLLNRDVPEALRLYRVAYAINSKDFNTVRKLAQAQRLVGLRRRSARNFSRAAALRPWLGAAWLEAATAHELAGDIPKAVWALRQANRGIISNKEEVRARRRKLKQQYLSAAM